MTRLRAGQLSATLSLALVAASGCSDSTKTTTVMDMGTKGPQSKIEHLVVIVQENHTFDNYFGQYCTAATGSNPTCNTGPTCCEAGPAMVSGTMPTVLDDAENGRIDRNHYQACETQEIDGGLMDKFVTGAGAGCSAPENFAYAPAALIQTYRDYASQGSMADRYFQPAAGQSTMNDMYLARAKFVFLDNAVEPNAIGKQCSTNQTVMDYTDQTVADLLLAAKVTWAWYGAGYQAMKDATATGPLQCPDPPSDCPIPLGAYPCVYDPSDDPFAYYPTLKDNPTYFRDAETQLPGDLSAGTLPAVSFVKAIGYKSEHPSVGMKISDGVTFVKKIVDEIGASSAASSTLILLTYDEGGGFYDHVSPPATSSVDSQQYGTRVPMVAIGPFAKKNYISHVTMEHSSIVKFIEWNWLGGKVGQLATRDATVANLGSLIDATAAGATVPEM